MQIKRFRCFGTSPDSGNEALVIFEGGYPPSSIAQRQHFAAERRANACVFITMTGGVCILDFYYPHTRSPLCLHASLAAAYYLQSHNVAGYSGSVVTAMKNQVLAFTCTGNEVHISVAPTPVNIVAPAPNAVSHLLGCAVSAIKSVPLIASIGSPKLLVEMLSPVALYALRPSLDEIAVWGKSVGVSGIYAYAHRELNTYEGRNFNHLEESLEDAATGVAAGALCIALRQDIILQQGIMLGNSCQITASADTGTIRVGGLVYQGGITVFLGPAHPPPQEPLPAAQGPHASRACLTDGYFCHYPPWCLKQLMRSASIWAQLHTPTAKYAAV